MSVAHRFKEARKYRGYSQNKLADELGVSRGVITNIEYEKTEPSCLVVNAVCNILSINKEWLVHGSGEKDAKLTEDPRLSDAIKALGNDNNTILKNIARNLMQLNSDELKLVDELITRIIK